MNGRFPRRYMTDQGRALKEKYQWQARAQWRDSPLKGEVRMHVMLYFGTKRRADWDNFRKLSCDALNGIASDRSEASVASDGGTFVSLLGCAKAVTTVTGLSNPTQFLNPCLEISDA